MSQTIPGTITTLGTPPSTLDPTSFDSRADSFLAQLPTMVTQLNSVNTTTYNNAVDAYTNAASAAVSAAASAADATIANAAANFKGTWSSLTGALNKPASVFHSGAFWSLLNNLANVTTSQPGVSADWQVCGGAFPLVPISTNQTAAPWKTYVITAACTLTAPAIAGSGQQFGIVVLPGVTGAVFAPAGSDKTRGVAGSQSIDAPFTAILTDSGATYGWI